MKDMQIEYDNAADAIYIHIETGSYARGEDLDDERRVDYDSSGTPIGVELLCVSQGVNIGGLPHADEIAGILEARGIKVYEVSCSYTGLGSPDLASYSTIIEEVRQSAHLNVAVLV